MRARNKLVKGVGINDVDEPTSTIINGKVVKNPFYLTWSNMMSRCYNLDYHRKRPSYIGCAVCEDWVYFSNFKSWMEKQDWQGKQLDKDLLVGGNKVYSPDFCLFVPIQVNASLVLNTRNRGKFPVGVSLYARGGTYKAECYNGKGSKEYLGYFSTPLLAHRSWQVAKVSALTSLRESQSDFRVRSGLQRIIDKIQGDYNNHRETVDFN